MSYPDFDKNYRAHKKKKKIQSKGTMQASEPNLVIIEILKLSDRKFKITMIEVLILRALIKKKYTTSGNRWVMHVEMWQL